MDIARVVNTCIVAARIAWQAGNARERCWLCRLRSNGGILCPGCLIDLPAPHARPPCPAGISAVHVGYEYRFPVDRLVRAAKYHADFAAERAIVAAMLAALPGTGPDAGSANAAAAGSEPAAASVLVPMPLHPHRQRWRGFNQARRIATGLARARGDIVLDTLLRRCRAGAPQSGSDRAGRAANVRGAFAASPAGYVPSTLVLVDDVITTGATAASAAAALHAAGVRRVELWCFAWAPPGGIYAG